MATLGGEKASQLVTNYDSHVWLPGSFRSTTAATGSPISGSAFAGWVYSADAAQDPPLNQNLVIHAYDLSDPVRPGRLFTKEKRAGVWASAWTIETNIAVSPTPPTGMRSGALWWDNDNGILYVNYKDVDSTQWVQAVAMPALDPTVYALLEDVVLKTGGTMTGPLTLSGAPVNDLHAATKLYVDAGVGNTKVSKSGGADGVMTGLLTLSGNPTDALHAVPKQYVDGAIGSVVPTDGKFYARQGTAWVEVPRYQRVSLAGGKSFDVTVPIGATAARLTGLIVPSSATATQPAIVLSVSAGVFRTTAGDYSTYGFYHLSYQNTVSALNAASAASMPCANPANNIAAPIFVDGTLTLKRPNTTVFFTGSFNAVTHSSSNGAQTSTFTTFMATAAAGSVLDVLAFRIFSATGDNWAANSYLNVEWL